MEKSLMVLLLLFFIGAWCLVTVETQCKEEVTRQFGAVYHRVMRIGEDNYEEFDEGNITYDGIGYRMVIVTDPNSKTRKLAQEFTCRDDSMDTGFKSVVVLLNGTCWVRKGYFFNLEIPGKDDHTGDVVIGGGNEAMKESIYRGRSNKWRHEFFVTTNKCGPVKIAYTDIEQDYHLRWQFYDLTTNFSTDAFIIKCAGEPNEVCKEYY